MRKLFISILMMLALGVNNSSAQITRQGMTFKASPAKRNVHKGDTLVSPYLWEDSKGKTYVIIVNKGSGSCYVWKKSAKTGKMYKMYMKPEVSQQICKELKIEYKPRKK